MLLDPSGRGPSALRLTVSGLTMILVIAAALYLLMLRYTGHFTDRVTATALLTSTGDGLPAHADVKFRGMVIGTVDSVEVVAKGARQRVDLALKPAVASTIPANVTARVIPNNIFGVTAIELVDNGATTAKLTAGANIPEDTGAATIQLQTTLNVLRTVLTTIAPEKLGRVLATLSEALDGSARAPGSTVQRLDNWLTQVHQIPRIGDLLGDLGRAATALSVSAPDLVGVLSDSVTTARTLADRRANLIALLGNASGAVDSVNTLFARNPDAGKYLVSGLDDLFGGLARDPDALPFTAANLNTALQRLNTTFRWGPKRQMVWTMDVSFTPFQQYTAKDCPHYGELYGPRCGGVSVPNSAPPQQYPPQLLPGWLDAAGPRPVIPAPGPIPGAIPGLPPFGPLPMGIPGFPPAAVTPGTGPGNAAGPAQPPLAGVPGAPLIPGLTAPAAVHPAALRGPDAVAAIVGGHPNTAQLLLLGPVLAGGHLTVTEGAAGQ